MQALKATMHSMPDCKRSENSEVPTILQGRAYIQSGQEPPQLFFLHQGMHIKIHVSILRRRQRRESWNFAPEVVVMILE